MKRILFIEPDFYKRVDLEDILSPHGFQVISVKDRYAALMKLKSQIFSLILTELQTNDADLFFLLKSLRETDSKIPVVVLANKPTKELISQLTVYKPIEVIVMPFSIKHLAIRLNQIVKKSS
ncbi:MAG: hypothetical protein CSA81_03565 [Acidobacteria bacterium]|nr:MAG: hypothetical protein CSA81_03565 [Acidobacteriota bacterium]